MNNNNIREKKETKTKINKSLALNFLQKREEEKKSIDYVNKSNRAAIILHANEMRSE